MTARIHGISYLSGPFLPAKRRLETTMPIYFEDFKIYGFEDLDQQFVSDHQEIFNYKRGGGYWIWKFHIVSKHLELINDDEILFYVDGGCTFNGEPSARNIFNRYIDIVKNDDKGILAFRLTGLRENCWTKQAMVTFLESRYNLDLSDHMLTDQRMATAFVVRKTPFSVKFFSEYNQIIRENDQLLIDSKERESPSFKEHRHDQSLFSLLTKIYNVTTVKDNIHFWGSKDPIRATRLRK